MGNQVSVPPVLTGSYALFFDPDGTLVGVRPYPDQVVMPDNMLQVPNVLTQQQSEAVALISGRSMAELDALTHSWWLSLAGVHGARRCDVNGKTYTASSPSALRGETATELISAPQGFLGCELGSKETAFALHYHQASQRQGATLELAQRIVQRYPLLVLQLGKCVVEIKSREVNKGEAISVFTQEAPFASCEPAFIGDDLIDEAGSSAINQLQGTSVKAGAGETQMHWRSVDAVVVRTWLRYLVYDAQTERKDDHEPFGCNL